MNPKHNHVLKADETLPEIIKLRSGAFFEPKGNQWRFQDGAQAICINFDTIPREVASLIPALKIVIIDCLGRNSPKYASNMVLNFRKLAMEMIKSNEVVDRIETSHLLNAISNVGLTDTAGYESQWSALLNRWYDLGIEGVSPEVIKLLEKRRKKGNVKGRAVMTLDPVYGPLNDLEFDELMSAVTQAYAENRIDEKLFLLTWLVVLTGQRPCQYGSMKVKDVVRLEEAGNTKYEIYIPKAKQRDELHRDSFLKRPLPVQVGESLWEYSQQVRTIYADLGDEAPLFPTKSKVSIARQINDGFAQHMDSGALGRYFSDGIQPIAPITMRTGEPIHITVGRFRDTIGTRAAQEGHGELIIAEILGHSDTQNVRVYVAATPEVAIRLDSQLARELAPIANVFKGIVIRSDSDPNSGNQCNDIVDYANSGKKVGSCGTCYDCKLNAPIACYVCHAFVAWLDAPHEQLLAHLLKQREELMITSGPRIASINDRVILALQSVVDTCAQIKAQEAMEGRLLNG